MEHMFDRLNWQAGKIVEKNTSGHYKDLAKKEKGWFEGTLIQECAPEVPAPLSS
jgi:hypothetical protein